MSDMDYALVGQALATLLTLLFLAGLLALVVRAWCHVIRESVDVATLNEAIDQVRAKRMPPNGETVLDQMYRHRRRVGD